MSDFQEPWNIEHPFGEPGIYVAAADTSLVCCLSSPDRMWDYDNAEQRAARIVACVNNCKGINPDAIRETIAAATGIAEWLRAVRGQLGPTSRRETDAQLAYFDETLATLESTNEGIKS